MNCDAKKVREIRMTLLDQGIQLPVDSCEWVVIFPWHITAFRIYRQTEYYRDSQSDLSQVVFK